VISRSCVNYYNIWEYKILFTRIGKKGKLRLMLSLIRMRHEYPHHITKKEQCMVDDLKIVEGLEPSSPVSLNKLRKICIKAIPTKIKDNNLMNLSGWDLISYITAFSLFLKQVSVSNINFIEEDILTPNISVSIEDIKNIAEKKAINLSFFIINIVKIYGKDESLMKELCLNIDLNKNAILLKLIKYKSRLAKSIIDYMRTDIDIDELMNVRVAEIIETYKEDGWHRASKLKSLDKLNRYLPACQNNLKLYLENKNAARNKYGPTIRSKNLPSYPKLRIAKTYKLKSLFVPPTLEEIV